MVGAGGGWLDTISFELVCAVGGYVRAAEDMVVVVAVVKMKLTSRQLETMWS